MRAGDLPEEVRRFITEHIDSVEQLEILLLLYQHPEHSWTAESVARELRISALSSDDRLKDMARSALLSKVQGSEVEYLYAPESQQLREVVAGLATAYAERRVTVINLIFSKPVDKIRTFADAFRLRRDDDDNG